MYFEEINSVLGWSDTTSVNAVNKLSRIQAKLTTKFGDAGFAADVERAEAEVEEEGTRALMQCLMQVTAAPAPKVYKIKRVAKGQRIKVASASGKKFAFGPVWVDAVKACKGIALNEANREKLNMHATTVGIENPEKLTARELCAAIAAAL